MQSQESSLYKEPGRGGGHRGHEHGHAHGHGDEDCGLACGAVTNTRNRYFYGKYMTARDFQDEQDYFVSHHRLHNRLLHGWGIVCGLVVSPHNERCPNYVVVSPGIAIDCCGREIILERATAVRVWQPAGGRSEAELEAEDAVAQATAPTAEMADEATQAEYEVIQEQKRKPGTPEPADPGPYLLVIRYHQERIELAPALYSEEDCDPRQMEANRVMEGARIEAVAWDAEAQERYGGCWPDPNRTSDVTCREDCMGDPPRREAGCLEPACQCDLGVPLALIVPQRVAAGYAATREATRIDGRRDLQTPAEYLTHIAAINWPHGGRVPLSELRDPTKMNGELRVEFDRRLMPPPEDDLGNGINRMTFTVEYHRDSDLQYTVTELYNDDQPPKLDEKRCAAIYTIERELLEGRQTLGDCILRITLKCDFILDCLGRLVDGEHLKGKLPSGDGRPGGTFESWFRVVDDLGRRPRSGGKAAA